MFENKQRAERNGKVSYHRNIINSIVSLATSEIEGVAEFGTDDYKKKSRLCRIDFDGNNVYVEVFVKIKHGYSVSDIACKIQENIKRGVDTMTNFAVAEVNVHVVGVVF